MRRLEILTSERGPHFTSWEVGSQPVPVTFDGAGRVADAGLGAARARGKPRRVLADRAERPPDPRPPEYIEHSAEAILTREVEPIRAGYPDGQDAQALRDDPRFRVLAGGTPDADDPPASGATRARFPYARTRRQAELPWAGRPVRSERRAAPTGRGAVRNEYPVARSPRTRRTPPAEVIPGVAAGGDPVHGRRARGGYHGSYRRQPHLPLVVYDGATGFPPAARLRPGTVPASPGAADTLDRVVTEPRAAGPGGRIGGRSGNGPAVPGLYDHGAAHAWPYAFGYATDAVLRRAAERASADLELFRRGYGRRASGVQRRAPWSDYRADRRPHPRRVVAEVEATPQGPPRRFVVATPGAPPGEVYRDSWVRRGRVPEQPTGGMRNGSRADRLSARGFCARASRLLVRTPACAIVVPLRGAVAAVPGVATATVDTPRRRLWEAGAVVVRGVRRTWRRVSGSWPYRGSWVRVPAAVRRFVSERGGRSAVVPGAAGALPRCAYQAGEAARRAAGGDGPRRGHEDRARGSGRASPNSWATALRGPRPGEVSGKG